MSLSQTIKSKISDFRVYWNIPMPGRYMTFKEMSNTSYADIKIPILSFISPTLGFISLLAKQLGQDSYMFGSALEELAPNGYIISIIFQLIFSVLFIKLSAYKLNPLNKKKKR